MTYSSKAFSVKDVEERLGVGEHTILGWIRSGELKAINVGRVAGKRPKWRITAEALAQFELGRESGGTATATKAKKAKRKADPEVLPFYS